VVHSGKIINSLVEDVIMPIVGLLTGGVDFTQKFIALDGGHMMLDAAKSGTAVIYGNLLQATINFVIIALFVLILMRKMKKRKEVIIAAATF
jgi:large conductance mechanosensitive channel